MKLRIRRPRRSLALLAALALAATACGSTVPRAQLEAALASQSQNGGLGGPNGGSNLPGSTSGGLPGVGGTTGTGGAGTGLGGPGGAAGGGALGPGINKTTIYVGLIRTKNSGAGNAALGATGNSGELSYKPYDIVIDDINSKGGIAGRKIAPVWAEIDATSSQPIDQQAQAACARWTQDNKVFAILGGVQGGVVEECTERAHGVNIIPAGDSTPDTFRRYPHFVEVSGMNIVRQGPVTVRGIARLGYFDKGTKLGIVTWDALNYRQAIHDGYLPELKKIGITPATAIAYAHVPASFNDLGGTNSDVNSAVLRFSQQHIDHVMIIDGAAGVCAGACLGFEFLNQAQSQGFHPRYGFNDYNYADTSVDSLYPHQQLSRSVAVVWSDDQPSQDVGYHLNKAREDCYALMEKHGFEIDDTSTDVQVQNQNYIARSACEQLWFMRAVVAKMGNAVLNNDNFMAGVNQIGASFQSLNTYVSRLGPNKHDGASAVRNQQYFDSCTCYRYTSAPYEV